MLKISKVSQLSDINNSILRHRAECWHCPRSKEFLASYDGVDAGFLSYEEWDNTRPGFICEVFVLPQFRQQGIGKSLLLHAEMYALQLGCKSVRLKPYSLDQSFEQSLLIRWYLKEGYYQTPDDQKYMMKKLHA